MDGATLSGDGSGQLFLARLSSSGSTSWAKTYRSLYPELMSPDEYDKQLDAMFYSSFPHCKGK